jgi:hypothetical protein
MPRDGRKGDHAGRGGDARRYLDEAALVMNEVLARVMLQVLPITLMVPGVMRLAVSLESRGLAAV